MSVPIKDSLRNPATRSELNPARNWQINPARNWQINPARNWQINPARNWQINPFKSSGITGKYLINCSNGTCDYYTVRCSVVDVMIMYDDNNSFVYFCVGHNNHYSVFDINYNYCGFMTANSNGNYNWFSNDGAWIYYTV